jgi:hypothetical protein
MPTVECENCKAVTTVDLKLNVPAPSTGAVSDLPQAEFVMITWSGAETGAMATVFGAGKYHFDGEDDNNATHAPSSRDFSRKRPRD